jgi:hypothetical protein
LPKPVRGKVVYSVIPLSDFYPLEEENGDYLLNETYRFTYNKKKSNGILKLIGSQDICDEMMESLVSLQQDEALRAKKNKQPTNKEEEQLLVYLMTIIQTF